MNTKEDYIRQLQEASERDLFHEMYVILHALDETVTLEKEARKEKRARLREKWGLVCDEVETRTREKEKTSDKA